MGKHFDHFKTVVYIPAQVAAGFTAEKLNNDYAFLEKYIGLDKVYLETHRSECDVEAGQINMIKSVFEEKGVEVSGGITTIVNDFEGAEPGKQRLFGTFCYTDPAHRQEYLRIVREAAEVFDEIILDDYFFTSCRCEMCIAAKGKQSSFFRR